MKKKIAILVVAVMALSFVAGCGQSSASGGGNGGEVTASQSIESVASPKAEAEKPATNDTKTTTVKVAGSTSVAPLMKKLKEAYEKEEGTIAIEIQESGSSAGITATIEGAANIGMSSRDLKDAEKEKGLVDIAIALDGIAVVVHKDNKVSNLTSEQITAIYKGEITDWSELGGDKGEIIVVSREEGSGTRGAYEELMKLEEQVEKNGKNLKQSLLSKEALFENSTGAVKSNVAGSKNAIGYISLGAMDDTVKPISVNGIICSEETIKDKTYTIARPFLVCTLGEAVGDTKNFIDFMLSEKGQAIVSENNYIKVID